MRFYDSWMHRLCYTDCKACSGNSTRQNASERAGTGGNWQVVVAEPTRSAAPDEGRRWPSVILGRQYSDWREWVRFGGLSMVVPRGIDDLVLHGTRPFVISGEVRDATFNIIL